MLYETLSQPLILFFLLLGGFCSGLVFDVANLIFYGIKTTPKLKEFFRHILDFVCTIIVGIIFFVFVLKLCYGEIRFYQVLFFYLALFLERKLIGKYVAKMINLCYIKLRKIGSFFKKCLQKFFKKDKNGVVDE